MKDMINYLIVEDDVTSMLIVKYELILSGFQINYKYADNLEDIYMFLDNHLFDFIISDHQMPGFSSLDVLKIRNKLASSTPFIIFSMDISKAVEEKAYEHGCTSVVNKSEIQKLPSLVESLLNQRSGGYKNENKG